MVWGQPHAPREGILSCLGLVVMVLSELISPRPNDNSAVLPKYSNICLDRIMPPSALRGYS